MAETPPKRILYITYNGLGEPIPQSQVIPYLEGLSRKGYEFILLSFEKAEFFSGDGDPRYDRVRETLAKSNVRWYWLRYHKRPKVLVKVWDILAGIFYGIHLARKHRVGLVHARSQIVAHMAQVIAKACGIGFVYDMRGLLADDYVSGGMWQGKGPLYHLLKWLDTRLILSAAATVVLTNRLAAIFKETLPVPDPGKLRLSVIPCCVDLERFKPRPEARQRRRRELGLEDRFVVAYSGSLGTWYMLSEMLDFFAAFQRSMPKAHFLILTPTDHAWVRRRIETHAPGFKDYTLRSVSPFEVAEFVAAAECGLMFIMPVTSKLASCPTKFAEFLACGLPVVVNAGIGDLDETVLGEKVGVMVGGFSEADYGQAVERLVPLLEDRALPDRCRAAAIKLYALEDGVEKYSGIYGAVRWPAS